MRIKSLKLRNTVRMIKERLDALNIFLQTSGKRLQGDERADMLARVTQILRDLDTKVQALDNSTIGENGLKKAIYDVNTLVTRLEAQSGISEAPVAPVSVTASASASNSASGRVNSSAPVSAAIPTVRQLLRREPSLTNNAVRQATAQAAKPVVSQKMENNSPYTSVYGEPPPAKGGRRTNRKTKTKSARKTKSKKTVYTRRR